MNRVITVTAVILLGFLSCEKHDTFIVYPDYANEADSVPIFIHPQGDMTISDSLNNIEAELLSRLYMCSLQISKIKNSRVSTPPQKKETEAKPSTYPIH